jgi:hypothetical protein
VARVEVDLDEGAPIRVEIKGIASIVGPGETVEVKIG